jgi:hypothetical protein
VQVAPFEPTLKPPGTKRLKLKCDNLFSSSAFNFNVRRYNVGRRGRRGSGGGGGGGGGSGGGRSATLTGAAVTSAAAAAAAAGRADDRGRDRDDAGAAGAPKRGVKRHSFSPPFLPTRPKRSSAERGGAGGGAGNPFENFRV